MHASSDFGGETEPPRERDPFAEAGRRLQNLLSGVGDGETEMINDVLLRESGLLKIGLAGIAASLIVGTAAVVCWLSGTDLLGGASLSFRSLHAAEVGLLVSPPLVAAKAWMWTKGARSAHPGLDTYLQDRLEQLKPLLSNMSLPQAGVAMLLDTVPMLLVALPAAIGGLTAVFTQVCSRLQEQGGYDLPAGVPFGLALGTIVAVTAAVPDADTVFDLTDEEEIVSTARKNADRYYQLMTPEAPDKYATAFKAVADAWQGQQHEANKLGSRLLAAQILYLGLVWHATGDLAAPTATALAASCVDTWEIYSSVNKPPGSAQRD